MKHKGKDTNFTAPQRLEVLVIKEEVIHDEDPLKEVDKNVSDSTQASDENITVKEELELGPTLFIGTFEKQLNTSNKAIPVEAPSPTESSDVQSLPPCQQPAKRLKTTLSSQDDGAAAAFSRNARKSDERMDLEKERLRLRDKELQLQARWHDLMKESLSVLRDLRECMRNVNDKSDT